MKYEDLLRMARAANVPASWELNWYDPYLDRFADIVAAETLSNIDPSRFMSYQEGFEAGAAAERERIIAANAKEIKKVNAHLQALEDAVAAEREACAQVCEELLERPSGYQGQWEGYGKFKTQMTGQECAEAIRARGETK